jgi:hypothetical protein
VENMSLYEKVRSVPKEALKLIGGGRLKGMSDINPMWRIKMLTELFGICGIGWKIEIVDRRLEHGGNNEIVCFVDINLYVKSDGVWSESIPGMGGSSFVTLEKGGLYTSDECFKMAYTDAISVACKSLGFAADVYYANDRTKYTKEDEGAMQGKHDTPPKEPEQPPASLKAKYELGVGSMDGFEKWADAMKKSNKSFAQMEQALTKKLADKSKESVLA